MPGLWIFDDNDDGRPHSSKCDCDDCRHWEALEKEREAE